MSGWIQAAMQQNTIFIKSFTRFALQSKCCNFNQWEHWIYNRSCDLYLQIPTENHRYGNINYTGNCYWNSISRHAPNISLAYALCYRIFSRLIYHNWSKAFLTKLIVIFIRDLTRHCALKFSELINVKKVFCEFIHRRINILMRL